MRVLVLAGGDLTVTQEIQTLAASADYVIAADSGLRHTLSLNLTPNLIVGDFDSVSEHDLAKFADIPHETHPTDKDFLDLEIALNHAKKLKASSIILFGATGSRLDQSFAALMIAAKHVKAGHDLSIYTGKQSIYYLAGTMSKTFDLVQNALFSVLSFVETSVVSLSNASYPLECHSLNFGVGLGVSNRVAKTPLSVSLKGGLIAVIVEHNE